MCQIGTQGHWSPLGTNEDWRPFHEKRWDTVLRSISSMAPDILIIFRVTEDLCNWIPHGEGIPHTISNIEIKKVLNILWFISFAPATT